MQQAPPAALGEGLEIALAATRKNGLVQTMPVSPTVHGKELPVHFNRKAWKHSGELKKNRQLEDLSKGLYICPKPRIAVPECGFFAGCAARSMYGQSI